MSQYFNFDNRNRNEFYTYTEDEENERLERVHLAGHYRYYFTYHCEDHMKQYRFRGRYWGEEFYDSFFGFESDDINDMYIRLYDFIVAIEKYFPILLYDNCESYRFFGGDEKKQTRSSIRIDDHVNNTKVNLAWDDILKQYHMLKLFGLLEDEQDEKEE